MYVFLSTTAEYMENKEQRHSRTKETRIISSYLFQEIRKINTDFKKKSLGFSFGKKTTVVRLKYFEQI